MIVLALFAWAALLLVVVAACVAARRGEAASVDTAEADPAAPPARLNTGEERLVGLERAA